MMIGESKDLLKERYVCIWADGIYFNVRSDDAKQCLLVIIGVTESGAELDGSTARPESPGG